MHIIMICLSFLQLPINYFFINCVKHLFTLIYNVIVIYFYLIKRTVINPKTATFKICRKITLNIPLVNNGVFDFTFNEHFCLISQRMHLQGSSMALLGLTACIMNASNRFTFFFKVLRLNST